MHLLRLSAVAVTTTTMHETRWVTNCDLPCLFLRWSWNCTRSAPKGPTLCYRLCCQTESNHFGFTSIGGVTGLALLRRSSLWFSSMSYPFILLWTAHMLPWLSYLSVFQRATDASLSGDSPCATVQNDLLDQLEEVFVEQVDSWMGDALDNLFRGSSNLDVPLAFGLAFCSTLTNSASRMRAIVADNPRASSKIKVSSKTWISLLPILDNCRDDVQSI